PRPRSAVSAGVGAAGLIGLGAWTIVARTYGMDGPYAALAAMLACGVPMVLWSLLVDRVHRNPTTGIDWSRPARPLAETLDISIAKLAGLWGIWGVIGALYCIARWYWDGDYLFAMKVLGVAAIPMLVLSVPYVIWLDRRLVEPRDGAWHFGQLLVGRGELVDRETLYDFFRAWAVKGFFLAFMISIVPGNWRITIGSDAAAIVANPVNLANWLIGVMFMVDVVFATVGYVLTMKPLDAHIRSANPYAAGWVAALICYPPFILMNPGGPLNYHPGAGDWTYWLADYPLATALIGAWLVFLTAIYAWATVAFGIRFSNLTHRGVLTHGPYAWTKHPAYVSKNLFWWFAVLPFLATTGNPVDMIRNTVVLAMVSGVYYWRALTEERHLMADPAYREYAEWMDRNAPIPRLINRLKPKWPRLPDAVPAE
ncbi:MAG: protein-S-isoprenylcysteine methyltransferase, partial [Pseudomonadota bacterium]|nr:protein-S-isoprenylcysteine methyltransferase [Pseudomonadota bacterium]